MSKRRGGFRLKGIPVRFKTRKARDRYTTLLAAGLTPRIAFVFAVSFLTKLGAASLGAWVAGRRT